MLSLMTSGYIPAPYVPTTGGDPTSVWFGIIALLAVAIAVTVALVYAGGPRARAKPVEKTFTTTHLPTAA